MCYNNMSHDTYKPNGGNVTRSSDAATGGAGESGAPGLHGDVSVRRYLAGGRGVGLKYHHIHRKGG